MNLKTRLPALLTALLLAVTSIGLVAFAADDDIAVRRVTITSSKRTLSVDDSYSLDFTYQPEDATVGLDFTWRTSNSDVVEVDSSGEITAIAPGTATISVRSSNGKSDSISVTVPGRVDQWWPDGYDRYGNPIESSSSTSSSTPRNAGDIEVVLSKTMDRETLVDAVKSAGRNRATLVNYKGVSVSNLKAAAGAGKALVNFDTKYDGAVMGRLTVDPAKAAKLTDGTIKLGVYHKEVKTQSVLDSLNSKYENTLYVVKCDQNNYGMTVRIQVKVGKNVKAGNLKFYSYDTADKTLSNMNVSNVTVDSAGYVGFDTTRGGTIVISVGELKRS